MLRRFVIGEKVVNSSPGLEGIEGSTGTDVSGMLVELIERNAVGATARTRGKG